MKKILLTLGSLAAVAAPVAAVVACGSSNGGNQGYTGGAAPQTDAGKEIDKMMSGYDSQSPYEHFTLNADFIGNRLFNSKTTGLAKNVTRSNWFKDGAAMWGFGHKSSPDGGMSTKVLNATKVESTLNEISFTKKDIIADANFFETKLASLNLDSTKQYIYSVNETKADSLKNEGEYKLSIWESKNPSTKVASAIKVLQDDFAFSDQSIKELSGTYLFSQPHMFSIGNSTFGLESTKSSHKGTYNDRANGDNLIDWTGYGPKAKLTDAQKADLKDTVIMSKVIVDNKTKEQNIQLTIRDKNNNSKTIYVSTRKIAELNETSTFDQSEFSKVWKSKMQFQPVYNLFSKLKGQVGQLADLGMPGMVDYVIKVSSKINLLASTYDFSNTDAFIKEFGNYLTSDKDFNEKAMLNAMSNTNFAEFNDVTSLGSKAYLGLYWLERTYSEFEKFIKDSEVSHKDDWVIKTINSPTALNTVLIQEANKAKIAAAGKLFLDSHIPAVDYTGMLDDDIIALVNKTKAADYKSAVDALKSTVDTFKATFTGLGDIKKGTSDRPLFSDKTVALAKFLDDNGTTIFGSKFVFPGFSGTGTNWNFDHSFQEGVKDGRLGHDLVSQRGMPDDFTVSGFINNVLKKVFTSKQFDTLQAVVLNPLGLVA